MSSPAVPEAVAASQRLLDRGDIDAAMRVLDDHSGDTAADLQRGSVAAAGVLLDGRKPDEALAILTPHIEQARALDLVGLAHFHAAITSGDHSLSEAVGECTAASRMPFDDDCWRAENTLHIGMIQQRQGAHDIAEVYLRDAYRMSDRCSVTRVEAARLLGIDAGARGDESRAAALLEESLDVARVNRLIRAIPDSLLDFAELLSTARPDHARKLTEEAVDVARTLKCRRPLARALHVRGRHDRSQIDLEESRTLASAIGDQALLNDLDAAM